MKRSFCLSALVVGLSLTTASIAVAAPPGAGGGYAGREPQPAAESSKPTYVAQVEVQQPSDGQPSGTAPATGAAPADGSEQTTSPAVTIGTGTTAPAADTPQTAPEEPKAKPAPRPFAGSNMMIMNSMTTGTVFRGQQQDYNPTVETALWLLPRYAINKDFQLRGRLIVSHEWTNSDSTPTRNETQLSDTGLQLFYRGIPEIATIKPMIAANVSLPTSKASQSRTMVVTPGATLQLVRMFEHFLGGEAGLIGILSYAHPFFRSENPQVVDARPYNIQCVGGTDCNNLASGTMAVANSLSYALLAEAEWGKWNPAFYYLGASQWAYAPPDATNPVDGTPIQSAQRDPTTLRQTHYFSVWLDYNFNTFFTGEIGAWNATTSLNESGQYANPFFNRYADTRVYLAASFQLDNLVKALQGGQGGEAGVVRAKNTKSPIFKF